MSEHEVEKRRLQKGLIQAPPPEIERNWLQKFIKLNFILLVIVFGIIAFIYIETDGFRIYRTAYTGLRSYYLSRAVTEFRERHHALPGDLKDAAKFLTGCDESCNPPAEGAGDGVIGDKNFIRNLAPSGLHAESKLFWTHLDRAGLLAEPLERTRFILSDVHYASGYSDGGQAGKEVFSDEPLPKGTVIVLYSDEPWSDGAGLTEKGKQPLKPREARSIDMKQDDGQPGSGYVRAYGAPECVAQATTRLTYAENNTSRDCGLIFVIMPEKIIK